MTVTVSATNGAGTSSPITVLSEYSTAYPPRNVIHRLIGGGIAVSLIEPDPRAGTIRYMFTDEGLAWDCLTLHREASTFIVSDSDTPAVSMTYVTDGSGAGIALDDSTTRVWIVSIGYQEVDA